MNGRTQLVQHIEHCPECQKRQKKMETAESKTADKLETQIEICCIETELTEEDYL